MLEILLVSQLLPLISFQLSSAGELVISPLQSEFSVFFKTEHDLFSPEDTKSFFRIYGISPSPNRTFVSFVYEYFFYKFISCSLTPNDRPQYRTMIDYRSRVSTVLLRDVTQSINSHVVNIDTMIGIVFLRLNNVERNLSPALYAWEGKILYDISSMEQRIDFINLLREKFEPMTFKYYEFLSVLLPSD